MITENDIHGHEILRLVDAAQAPLTRATLQAEAARRWGPDARFRTCSSAQLTIDELLDFLVRRGKIVTSGATLAIDRDHVC